MRKLYTDLALWKICGLHSRRLVVPDGRARVISCLPSRSRTRVITSSHVAGQSVIFGTCCRKRFYQSTSDAPIQPGTPFQYRPLDADEIRLLRIRPQNSSYLHFSIQHFTRDKAPQYAALSYVWGEQPASRTVSVDGRTFQVRPNLHSCLNFILARQDITYLWIDAICIDQTNTLEKNEQVRRMDQTYRNASIVLTWLGWDGHGEEKIGTVKAVEAKRPAYFPVYFSSRTRRDHPYWSRMWVVQEVFLARKIEMISPGEGSSVVDDPGSKWDCSSSEERFRPGLKLEATSIQYLGEHKRDLAHMIYYTSLCDCQDPRDRIFALLSILSDDEREILSHFFPDYSLSLETVQLLTVAFLRQSRTFHILGSQMDDLHISSYEERKNLILRTVVDPEVLLARFEKFLALDFWYRVVLLKRTAGFRADWKIEKARLTRKLMGSRAKALQRLMAESMDGKNPTPSSFANFRAMIAVSTWMWLARTYRLWYWTAFITVVTDLVLRAI